MPEGIAQNLALLVERGGVLMLPLALLSVVSLALCLERAAFWLLSDGRARRARLDEAARLLRRGRVDEARRTIEGDRTPWADAVRRILDEPPGEAAAIAAAESVRPRLERFMSTLSTIITAAPLLGILGTVGGIIQSFRLLEAEAVLTDPRQVAGGIATALVTTAAGLVVALLTLFPYMVYRARVEQGLGRLEALAASCRAARGPAPHEAGPAASSATARTPGPAATAAASGG